MVNLIIDKSLNEVLALILSLDVPQRLVIMAHMHAQVTLVLLSEVDQRFGVHNVRQEVEALAHLFRVVDIR